MLICLDYVSTTSAGWRDGSDIGQVPRFLGPGVRRPRRIHCKMPLFTSYGSGRCSLGEDQNFQCGPCKTSSLMLQDELTPLIGHRLTKYTHHTGFGCCLQNAFWQTPSGRLVPSLLAGGFHTIFFSSVMPLLSCWTPRMGHQIILLSSRRRSRSY